MIDTDIQYLILFIKWEFVFRIYNSTVSCECIPSSSACRLSLVGSVVHITAELAFWMIYLLMSLLCLNSSHGSHLLQISSYKPLQNLIPINFWLLF